MKASLIKLIGCSDICRGERRASWLSAGVGSEVCGGWGLPSSRLLQAYLEGTQPGTLCPKAAQAHAPEGELRPPPDAKQTPSRLFGDREGALGCQAPLAALQSALPGAFRLVPLLLFSLWVRKNLQFIRGRKQFRPWLGKQAIEYRVPASRSHLCSQVRVG